MMNSTFRLACMLAVLVGLFPVLALSAQDDYGDLVAPGEEVFSALASEGNLAKVAVPKSGSKTAGGVSGFGAADSGVTWNFILPEARYYSIVFSLVPGTFSPDDTLEVYVNSKFLRRVKPSASGKSLSEIRLDGIFLKDGSQELVVWKGWKDLVLAGVKVVAGDNFRSHRPNDVPANPDASPEVRKVMKFLADTQGKKIIAGQQDLTWSAGIDMLKRVEQVTGKLPGLYGFDFLGISPSAFKDPQVTEAIKWWERGGLVAFCWHWKMGKKQEFYTKLTDYRINRNPESDEYKDMVKYIDWLAGNLKRLQAAKVPVLFRPLHEASGGWFWWGASGPTDYIWLWNFLYDRLTNYHKLNNLIWVWNGQSADWYPGNNTVDVIGLDIYPKPGDHSSQVDKYLEAMSFAQEGASKIIALTENGAIPDPENLRKDGAGWTWFMTWNDAAGRNDQENFWSGQLHNPDAFKKALYNSDYVLTLDEMPSFKE